MSILEQIHSPADLKALPEEEIPALCAELRSFLVENLAKTGGHLASNLGAVELTVAIDRVYCTEKDRLVFDVGHQSYVHKILTGRREAFSTLRQFGGIAGFPKPDESVHDAFVAGHASTSISVALGMARARTLTGADYDVIALIGDGALTGGLAYEGLSDAGQSGEPMVIVLNDNGMSINKNVGGMATLLSKQRVKPGYLHFKRFYRSTVGKARGLYKVLHCVKERVKDLVLPNNMFDDMGFYYIGPVDGHDEPQLEKMLRWARDLRQPVLLHVVTQKGKGVAYTEQAPEKYHGVSSFDPVTGALPTPKPDFSHVFGETLSQLADEDPTVVAITAAMLTGTGLTVFAERHPDRLYDVGIAEGHAVTMASGMAKQGLKPVAAIYSSFLQRAYDMLIHDTSLQRLHLVLGVDRAGIVGNAQRESALPATCHQSFGLRHHFLRTILADHTHASVDRSHDLTHVARFRGGKQAYGTCVTPGMLLRRCDAVQHTVHAIGDLHGTHTVDHLIGKILMVHICSHVQPLAFNPNYLYQSKKKPVRRSEVKR